MTFYPYPVGEGPLDSPSDKWRYPWGNIYWGEPVGYKPLPLSKGSTEWEQILISYNLTNGISLYKRAGMVYVFEI